MQEPRKSSRRSFLQGQSAVEALQDVAENLIGDDVANLPQPQSGGYLLRIGRRAMACEFEVLLNAKQYPHGTETALAALDLVDRLEAQLTVYRDDSEISQLNRSAHQHPIEVEPRLFSLLQRAAEIHGETGGAYDITSGALSKIWGFYRREGRVPSDTDIQQVLELFGMQHVKYDAAYQTLKFDRRGVELNLGSIGKGYALDRAAELLQEAGIEDFLLHGGNSSVLARGTAAANPDGMPGWWVGVRHPLRPDKRLGQIRLCNRALGTSGSGTQFFVHEGRRLGHILDPRTGRPAEGMLSTTVAASTGADADALATALYVLGPNGALEYCRRHPEISAVTMSSAKNATQANIMIWNLADDELQLDADPSLVIQRESATSAAAPAPNAPG
jgi:FAD:protein FMN transferase